MNTAIQQAFFDHCRTYAEEVGALGTDIVYHKKWCAVSVEQRLLKVEFVYVKKELSLVGASTLYCRLYLNKNSVVFHHLPDLLAAFNIDDFRSCYFSYIENAERMGRCFAVLKDMLTTYTPMLEQAVLDGKAEQLRQQLFESYDTLYQLNGQLDFSRADESGTPEEGYFLRLQEFRNDYLVNSFTKMGAYYDVLLGKRERAIKRYGKLDRKGKLSVYERRLYSYLQTADSLDFCPMPPECFSQKIAYQYVYGFNFSAVIKCFLAFYIPCAALFCLMCLLIQGVLTAGALFSLQAPWYMGLISAGLCSVFGTIAFRKPLMKVAMGKKARQAVEFDELLNPPGVDIFARVVFVISAIVALGFNTLIAADSVRFYKESFVYCPQFPFFEERVLYSEVDAVYHIDARYNVYDERIERSSYVIVMADGSYVDLDGYTSVDITEKQVLPLLTEQNIPVLCMDSDRQLPVVQD